MAFKSKTVEVENLWTSQQVAQYLNISQMWLMQMRNQQQGPPYIRIGGAIRYEPAEVIQWVEDCKRATQEGINDPRKKKRGRPRKTPCVDCSNYSPEVKP